MADGSGADALADPSDPTALEALHPLASVDVEIGSSLVHREVYTQRGVPLVTTLSGGHAIVQAISAMRGNKLEVCPLQKVYKD